MSNKLSLIFVGLMAISYVRSLPQLDIIDGNQLETMSSRPILTELSRREWDDLFVTAYFGDDSELNSTSFGPEFDSLNFAARLNVDIGKAYQRRCKKISGMDNTYAKIKAAKKELGQCFKSFKNNEEIRLAKAEGDNKLLIKTVCGKRDALFKCLADYMALEAQCSYPSEIETGNSLHTILVKISDLLCENDGNSLASLIFGQGHQCLIDNRNKIMPCRNEVLYAIVKGLVVKLVENETFEFKMDAEDCKSYDETQTCFTSAVKNCADPTVTRYISSVYEIVRNETSCAKNDLIETNLLN